MDDIKRRLFGLLVDRELDRLDDADKAKLEDQLAKNPSTRTAADRLARTLRPLDHWTVGGVPPSFVDSVMKRVETASREKSVSAHDQRYGGNGRPFASLRELGAVAACLVLLSGLLVPTVSGLRSRSQRVWCENNLGSVYRGVSAYQEDSAGSLPFAGQPMVGAWLPVGNDDRPFQSNSRHLYLLLKHGYLNNSGELICPGVPGAEPMAKDLAAVEWDDFPLPNNISYDSLNQSGERPNTRPARPIAYMGDANPIFASGQFDPSVDPSSNSLAHRKSGQNVLTLDGASTFLTSPVIDKSGDNVWLADEVRQYTGTETPTRPDDAQLVPGFPARRVR